jgi:hypothetical protein
MAGLVHPGPAIDPVFEAGALELQLAPAAAGIVRPNAARTFFEGPEGPYHLPGTIFLPWRCGFTDGTLRKKFDLRISVGRSRSSKPG